MAASGSGGSGYASPMMANTRKAQLIGLRDAETYLHREIDVPIVDGDAPQWLVEELPGNRFQPWRRFDGETNELFAVYYADASRDERQLVEEGYADFIRVPRAES